MAKEKTNGIIDELEDESVDIDISAKEEKADTAGTKKTAKSKTTKAAKSKAAEEAETEEDPQDDDSLEDLEEEDSEVSEADLPDPDGSDLNEFTFCGAVVTKYVNKKSVMLTLALNSNIGRKGVTNYPRIHIYDEEAVKKAANIKKYDKVMVKGYINSYKEPKPGFSSQVFIGTEILEPSSVLAKYGEDSVDADDITGGFVETVNEVAVRGRIDNTRLGRGNSMIIEVVSYREKKYLKKVKITWFPGEDDTDFYKFLRPGQRIFALGRCNTDDKEGRDGKRRHYESIVASTLRHIDPSKEKKK